MRRSPVRAQGHQPREHGPARPCFAELGTAVVGFAELARSVAALSPAFGVFPVGELAAGGEGGCLPQPRGAEMGRIPGLCLSPLIFRS